MASKKTILAILACAILFLLGGICGFALEYFQPSKKTTEHSSGRFVFHDILGGGRYSTLLLDTVTGSVWQAYEDPRLKRLWWAKLHIENETPDYLAAAREIECINQLPDNERRLISSGSYGLISDETLVSLKKCLGVSAIESK